MQIVYGIFDTAPDENRNKDKFDAWASGASSLISKMYSDRIVSNDR